MRISLWNFVIFTILLTSSGNYVLAQNRHRVVIVGAGLSGYSASAKLIENELDDVLVLEAENRIGGRVHTIPYTNGYIDMGAQWLHGQEGNLIYELIDGHFTFGDSSFENATYYFSQSDGSTANQTDVASLTDLSETIMDEVYVQDPSYLGTFGSYFVSNYLSRLRTATYNSIPWELALQVQNFFHTYTNNYFGTMSWFDISIAEYSTHGYTLGSQWVTWRNEGFSTVFEYLSKRLPDPSEDLNVESKISQNKTVTNMNWAGNTITLRCSDNTEYSADYVIFTPSLGVLKARHASLFTPQLPATKVFAINNSDYGTLEKIFLEFETPFWNDIDNFAQVSILWTPEDISDLVGTEREWLIEMAYFRKVDAFPNLLGTFFIGARIPNFENFTENKIIEDCTWLLRRTLRRPTIPFARRAIYSDWITQNNFLGGYSLLTMNSAHQRVSPSQLAEPVYNADGRPRIFFAGEHTSAEFSGYSNGAVATGFRAAEEVLKYANSGVITSKSIMLLIGMLIPAFLRL